MTVKKKQNRKSFKDIIKYNFDNLLMQGGGSADFALDCGDGNNGDCFWADIVYHYVGGWTGGVVDLDGTGA